MKRSAAPRSPGAERRKQLRQQRRNQRLRQAWQLLLLCGSASGLGYALLTQGWLLRDPSQVQVLGSSQVSREQVISAAELRFPTPLLSLQPRRLGNRLMAELPVEKVQVQRLMLPPRLRIELADRQAVARAERRSAGGLERGYVDRLGSWISDRQQQGARRQAGNLTIQVRGWQERHRGALAEVLAQREQLGSQLREISFDPGGNLWLSTEKLGRIRLGPVDQQLQRRLEVIAHLSKELPPHLAGRPPQSIDLSNPDQPELGLAKPPIATKGQSPAAGSPTRPD
ncbi:MAG: FtsQ-type POTRA domain-containing protein [Prochlorococcaceae cyanobacterium]